VHSQSEELTKQNASKAENRHAMEHEMDIDTALDAFSWSKYKGKVYHDNIGEIDRDDLEERKINEEIKLYLLTTK
jgi:hypothetical protein